MSRLISSLKGWFVENGSYKLVALFVTLILWVTILGRRDFAMSKDLDLEFLLPRNVAIAGGAVRKVEVKVAGPRMALKKFGQNPGTITIDLGRAKLGRSRVPIPLKSVEVPFGVKVLSVTPEAIYVTLIPAGQEDGKE